MRRSKVVIPPDLKSRLETARLDLLALFRSLDQMDLSAREIPQRLLQQLFELDADYAEALWVLDQPSHSIIGNPEAINQSFPIVYFVTRFLFDDWLGESGNPIIGDHIAVDITTQQLFIGPLEGARMKVPISQA